MKLKLLLLFVVLFSLQTNAQTLNPTVSITAAGTADTFKGGYTFAYPSSGVPWSGPLISFGGFSNQYDCQLNSNYGGNNISFRTRNGDIGTWNAWNELATRGVNIFNGNQSIIGNLGIGTTNPGVKLTNSGAVNVSNPTLGSGTIGANAILSYNGLYGLYTGVSNNGDVWQQVQRNDNNFSTYNLLLNPSGGNVGIGTTTPDQKLTVKGKIHAEEIIVDLSVPADYVFQKYYTGKSNLKSDYVMPTLSEIEIFTKENNHLPNVPSAKEIQQKGVSLGEMSNVLLQKVEELTLYMIEMKKENDELKAQVKALMDQKQ